VEGALGGSWSIWSAVGAPYSVVTEVVDKTAWQGGFWDGDVWVEDTISVITLPLGAGGSDVVVPRLNATSCVGRHRQGRSQRDA
jgi:hypothetical protein